MATHQSAIKRHRQNIKRNARNKHFKSKMRNTIKAFRSAVEENDLAKATELFPGTVSLIQKVSQKGIIHKNQASRRVKRLHSALHKLQQTA